MVQNPSNDDDCRFIHLKWTMVAKILKQNISFLLLKYAVNGLGYGMKGCNGEV